MRTMNTNLNFTNKKLLNREFSDSEENQFLDKIAANCSYGT